MSRQNIRKVGRSSQNVSVEISGILNNAMKAVTDAQKAVAKIQNIAHVDSGPHFIPPERGATASRGRGAGGSKVHSDRSAMRVTEGTLINIVNSQNVQIGNHNRMYILRGRHSDTSSESESEAEDNQVDCHPRHQADEETAEILRDSHRHVSDAELHRLSKHIGGAWRRLIRLLGIDDAEVDYIFHTHQSEGLEEVIYQLLKKWKQEQENPTVGKLIGALERADMTRLLHHLKP